MVLAGLLGTAPVRCSAAAAAEADKAAEEGASPACPPGKEKEPGLDAALIEAEEDEVVAGDEDAGEGGKGDEAPAGIEDALSAELMCEACPEEEEREMLAGSCTGSLGVALAPEEGEEDSSVDSAVLAALALLS